MDKFAKSGLLFGFLCRLYNLFICHRVKVDGFVFPFFIRNFASNPFVMDKVKETQSNELPQLPSGFEWGVGFDYKLENGILSLNFSFSPKLKD